MCHLIGEDVNDGAEVIWLPCDQMLVVRKNSILTLAVVGIYMLMILHNCMLLKSVFKNSYFLPFEAGNRFSKIPQMNEKY